MFNSPREAYEYAFFKNKKLKLEDEILIATDYRCSYLYASNVLNSRFDFGENTIASNADYASLYATNVLKSRFKLGEKTIANDDYSKNAFACYISRIFKNYIPADFLELCSEKYLEIMLQDTWMDGRNLIQLIPPAFNKEDVIKVLFKKRVLNRF